MGQRSWSDVMKQVYVLVLRGRQSAFARLKGAWLLRSVEPQIFVHKQLVWCDVAGYRIC